MECGRRAPTHRPLRPSRVSSFGDSLKTTPGSFILTRDEKHHIGINSRRTSAGNPAVVITRIANRERRVLHKPGAHPTTVARQPRPTSAKPRQSLHFETGPQFAASRQWKIQDN